MVSEGRFMERAVLVWILVVALLAGSCGKQPEDKPLRIAVAANARYALEELVDEFEGQTGKKAELVVSSSGKLTAQIEQGAPYHLLFSADMKYPRYLQSKGLAEKPALYALGQLVYWDGRDSVAEIGDLQDILATKGSIAIAQPELAPYGAATKAFLQAQGWWDILADRMVYGESVAQVNQYILTGAVLGGFTAKSVVAAPGMKEQGKWIEIPGGSYPAIEQGVVMTRKGASEHPENCADFLTLIRSEKGQDILRRYGYTIPEKGR